MPNLSVVRSEQSSYDLKKNDKAVFIGQVFWITCFAALIQ
jgi:hypothetical protein